MACVQGYSSGDTRAPTPPSAPTPHPSVAMCLMAMSQQERVCLCNTDPLHIIYVCCVYARVHMHDYLPAKQTMLPSPTPISSLLCVKVKKIVLSREATKRHTQAHRRTLLINDSVVQVWRL